MTVISRTNSGMIGKCGKPFCGDCCATFRQGSGRRWKRIGKHVEKRREWRGVRDEVEAELLDLAEETRFGYTWLIGCTVTEPCGGMHGEYFCLACDLNNEFHRQAA